ncbi:F0F1 ATP synthase subunit delta [Patescibacteria group bacterium]|nr:F0F1 ATP synthase subunit delta [Patescibacteria group bacterium]
MLKIVKHLVEKSFSDGRIIEGEVTKSIKTLKSLPRSQAIFAMSEFLKELRRKEREHTMIIETTISLSLAQINKMKKIVEKKVRITKVLVNINPEILGGFKLRIGDKIWDESVLGKIIQVKEVIADGKSTQSN